MVFRSASCTPAEAVALDAGVPGRSSEHSESLSREEEVDSLGNGFAALGGEKLLLLGDIRHHLGDFIQGLFCVQEVLAQEGVPDTQPHMAVLQWQEGDKEVNKVFLHKTAGTKATV